MIISRTPFRISFFGGGSDYPEWHREHGGQVLATTINKYCYLTCRYLPPFFEHRIRVVYSQIENRQSVDEIEHPAVRECLKYLEISRGVAVQHDGDLPARSGMGSSSSFTVGLLHALHALKGYMPSKTQLALEATHIERERLHETVGSQDQISASYGGFNHISFPKEGEFLVKPIAIRGERREELNAHLMLFYTGILRTASDVAGSYVPDIGHRESQMNSIIDMVDEGISILNGREDITRFGELLHEAWKAKSDLSSLVSNRKVDEIYDWARSGGAVGGKLLGAGGGGFMLLFVPPEKQERLRARLSRLIHVPFKFESSGSQIIFLDSEEDYLVEDGLRISQTVDAFQEFSKSSRIPHGLP